MERDNILLRSNVLYHYRVYVLLLAVPPPWGFHLSLLPPEEQTNKRKQTKEIATMSDRTEELLTNSYLSQPRIPALCRYTVKENCGGRKQR